MTATILDGRALAARITEAVHSRANALRGRGIVPRAVVFVGRDDPAGSVYAHSIKRRGEPAGIDVRILTLDPDNADDAFAVVRAEAARDAVHGALLQRPLPRAFDFGRFVAAIPLQKDVDAAHPCSLGLLTAGQPRFVPATAGAVMEMLAAAKVRLPGMRAVVIGRSLVVGKPVALLLAASDATVTLCHSRTQELAKVVREAGVVVAALGKPRFVTPDMIAPGAVVVDVGTNLSGSEIVGDVDPAVAQIAGALSPVPGGLGPVTTACFLRSVIAAAEAISAAR